MSGRVPISTRGIPSRSSEYRTPASVSATRWQDSSSSMMSSIRTGPSSVSTTPPSATFIVRWNPEVFDPSMTIFRITWTWSRGSMSSNWAISSVTRMASAHTLCGGSSSSSTRHVES